MSINEEAFLAFLRSNLNYRERIIEEEAGTAATVAAAAITGDNNTNNRIINNTTHHDYELNDDYNDDDHHHYQQQRHQQQQYHHTDDDNEDHNHIEPERKNNSNNSNKKRKSKSKTSSSTGKKSASKETKILLQHFIPRGKRQCGNMYHICKYCLSNYNREIKIYQDKQIQITNEDDVLQPPRLPKEIRQRPKTLSDHLYNCIHYKRYNEIIQKGISPPPLRTEIDNLYIHHQLVPLQRQQQQYYYATSPPPRNNNKKNKNDNSDNDTLFDSNIKMTIKVNDTTKELIEQYPLVDITYGTMDEEIEMRKWLDDNLLPQSTAEILLNLGARNIDDIKMLVLECTNLLQSLPPLDRIKLKRMCVHK